MELSIQEQICLIQEIVRETGARRDGSGRNLLVPRCPFCGKAGGKFGIYIGPKTAHRKPFMAHCFSCGTSTHTLEQLLSALGRRGLTRAFTGCFSDTPATLDCAMIIFPRTALT